MSPSKLLHTCDICRARKVRCKSERPRGGRFMLKCYTTAISHPLTARQRRIGPIFPASIARQAMLRQSGRDIYRAGLTHHAIHRNAESCAATRTLRAVNQVKRLRTSPPVCKSPPRPEKTFRERLPGRWQQQRQQMSQMLPSTNRPCRPSMARSARVLLRLPTRQPQ